MMRINNLRLDKQSIFEDKQSMTIDQQSIIQLLHINYSLLYINK